MSYHVDAGGIRQLIDKSECAHLADEYICTCKTSKYCMDVPPDGYCYKDGGCMYFKWEIDGIASDKFCKNQEKDTGG